MQITLQKMNLEQEDQYGTFQNILHAEDPKIDRLKQLEGQCKIHSFRPLQFDLVKTVLLIVPLIVSFVGLLLLKYFKSFRVRCFYKDALHIEAKYFFIESTDGHEDIEAVVEENDRIYVYFKNLKYQLSHSDLIPVGYHYQENFSGISSKTYIETGLSENIRQNNQRVFGRNQHKVQVPNYFQYMFDTLTKPFFLFQYVICIIFLFEKLFLYVGVYLGFSFFTTSVNYILLYRSYLKIKEMAEKETDVVTIRGGKRVIVKNHDLVPGDVVIPVKNQQVSYDGILISGEVFVNEASLTGESIPVGKFPASQLIQTKNENVWLVQGAKVLEAREESRVVIINIGYATRRGRIIRKILTRVPKVPDFFMSAVYFLFQTCMVGIIIYACTVNMMIVNGVVPAFVVFRFLDILAWSFPPTFPIYFNLAYSFSLVRLKWKGIFGTEPEKTTEAAQVKTFCFDKTGTLTQNEIEVYEIIKFVNDFTHDNITKTIKNPQNSLINKLFASCHTTRHTQQGLLGDEVDLRMFLHSQFKMNVSEDKNIRFIVENQSDRIEVLKINQFQSKFQNMSVLVKDIKLNKYYVFIKGAPERIDRNSVVKYQYYEKLVANLSLGGYRTIGYGYKEVNADEISKYLQSQREIFEQNITALGLIAFENKLKQDTKSTIEKLIESDIEPKMITGDNIFIAVQTGFRAGILKPEEKVVLLQGRKQTKYDKGTLQGLLLYKKQGEIVQEKIELKMEQYENETNYAIAIDNDFLMLKPEPILTSTIKLFARISPENKALIVRKFKKQEDYAFQQLSFSQRAFGRGKWKVGMCGDGANDLMAIRQADVGLGISDSDASYGASFTIGKMQDVEHIVRESKNTSQSIVDTIRYFGTISFLKIIASVILVSDVTYFNSNEITYFNFAHSIWLALFLSLSTPCSTPTKQRPNCNLMSLENHIIYWANIVFPTIGYFAGYYYFYFSSAFQHNPNPAPLVTIESGYTGVLCYTNTIVWLLINIPFICNAFVIYRSYPFKCRIYQNWPITVLATLNIMAAIAFFFVTSKLSKAFSLMSIPVYQSGITLLIMGVAMILSYIFNEIFKYFYIK